MNVTQFPLCFYWLLIALFVVRSEVLIPQDQAEYNSRHIHDKGSLKNEHMPSVNQENDSGQSVVDDIEMSPAGTENEEKRKWQNENLNLWGKRNKNKKSWQNNGFDAWGKRSWQQNSFDAWGKRSKSSEESRPGTVSSNPSEYTSMKPADKDKKSSWKENNDLNLWGKRSSKSAQKKSSWRANNDLNLWGKRHAVQRVKRSYIPLEYFSWSNRDVSGYPLDAKELFFPEEYPIVKRAWPDNEINVWGKRKRGWRNQNFDVWG